MTRVDTVSQEERLDPASAFRVLGNETRLAILRELSETRERPLSFSELRKRVGMRDGSQFNYHLQKLEPAYVTRTEDGYHITTAGAEVVTAIVAGTIVEHPTIPPFEIDGECVDCGGALLARYEDEMVCVDCADCGLSHLFAFLPPGGLLDRTSEEVVAASASYLRTCSLSCMDGVCPGCTGRVRRSILGPDETLSASVVGVGASERIGSPSGPGVLYECERCGIWYYLAVGDTLLFEPVVVEFFRDHGLDLHRTPLWTLPWSVPAVAHEYARIVTESPLRIEMRIPLEDETLVVTVDEALEVVETERTTVDGSALASSST